MPDARLWLLWALTALLAATAARNPLYLFLLLLVVLLVGVTTAPSGRRRAALLPLRFAALAIPFAAFFNGLTGHLGDTVLLRLPAWLPLLGGPVTLESLAYGAINGLALTAILGAFTALNQAVPVRELVRLTPRAFHEAGVVLAVALTLVPQTAQTVARIRQAQAVRGHRLRGLRDWLPIYLPLLVSGLERALALAEAMVARGYGAVSERAQPLPLRAVLVVGLLGLSGGWLGWLLAPAWAGVAGGVMVGGGVLLLGAVALAGRAARCTRYRPRCWGIRETLAVLGCGLALAAALAGQPSLVYSPYPRLSWPPFDPWVGLGLLGLLTPALVGETGSERR